MKRVVLVLLCILFLVLDNALAPFFSIKEVYPSLLFTFAILFSLVNGYWEAIIVGILSGVMQDSYFVYIFGLNMLVNTLLCIGAAYIGENIFKQRRLIPIIITFIATIIKFIALVIITGILGIKISLDGIFIMATYNMIIAFIIYGYIYRLSNKNFMKRQWKFSEK